MCLWYVRSNQVEAILEWLEPVLSGIASMEEVVAAHVSKQNEREEGRERVVSELRGAIAKAKIVLVSKDLEQLKKGDPAEYAAFQVGLRGGRYALVKQGCRLVTRHRCAPAVFPAVPAVFQQLRFLTQYPFRLAHALAAGLTHSRAGGFKN